MTVFVSVTKCLCCCRRASLAANSAARVTAIAVGSNVPKEERLDFLLITSECGRFLPLISPPNLARSRCCFWRRFVTSFRICSSTSLFSSWNVRDELDLFWLLLMFVVEVTGTVTLTRIFNNAFGYFAGLT